MTYTCPECGATSHHPTDEEVGWCGRCGAFTGGKSGLELQAILAAMVERGNPAVAGLANRMRQREEHTMDASNGHKQSVDILIRKMCPNGHGKMTLYQQAPDDDTDDFFECGTCGYVEYVVGQRSADPEVLDD